MLKAVLAVIVTISTASRAATAQAVDYDVVVRGGRVIDPESGLDAVRTLGIRNGKIAAISTQPLRGKRVIDAKGLVVAPGFVDLHRHGQTDSAYANAVRDGVTTAFELEVGVGDVDRFYREREAGQRINYGAAIGHIPVRMLVMGDSGDFLPSGPGANKVATPEQIEEMKRRLDAGLKQGAIGVGFGTAYTPAATKWEILDMFRVAGRYKAPAFIHVRNGIDGVQEAMADAMATGTPLHVVHINSTSGSQIVPMLAMLADARKNGVDVTTEAYPYEAGSTRLESALFDDWQKQPDSWFQQLMWTNTGERLTRETFVKYRKEGGAIIQFSNTLENVAKAIESPFVMIASDGFLARTRQGHPRASGTFSRVLGRHVREAGTVKLTDALRRMTLDPARRLEGISPAMRQKGRIKTGADADLVLFDARTIMDRATYSEPSIPPVGIPFVLVNGIVVVDQGELVAGASPGRGVRGRGAVRP
jgi:N-acyl-D-aspartate/D-glutamate deacylase